MASGLKSRRGAGFRATLRIYERILTPTLFRDGSVIELGCMAHARRKFFDLAKASQSPIAVRALRHIARLYRIEAKAEGKTTDERKQIRAKHAKPRLKLYYAWLLKTRATVPDGTGTAKAIDYTLKRWPALIRYAETGHLPIDNNPVENTIRPIAVGKNYAQPIIMRGRLPMFARGRCRLGSSVGLF